MDSTIEALARPAIQKKLLAVHEAIQPKTLGRAVVRLVEALVAPTRAVSLVLRPLDFVMPLMFSHPGNLALFQDWVRQNHKTDLWLKRARPTPRDRVVRHTDHTPDSVMVRSRFYQTCLPYDIRFGAALVVWRGEAPLAFVQILRRSEQGDFIDREMKLLASVYPHIAAAVRRIFLLHNERATRLSLDKFLHSLPEAMVLLDANLKVIHHNSAAEEMCARWNLGLPLARALKRNGHFELPPDVLAVCHQITDRPLGKPQVYSKPGQPRFSCRIRKVQLHASPLHRPMILLRFDDTAMMPSGRDPAQTFRVHSALTPCERELALLVCEGKSNGEIARDLCKSGATVRNQLHSIYEKLRISRRGQLIAQRWN